MKTSDFDFLIAALEHRGIDKEQVQDLIAQFQEVMKLEKERRKLIKTDREVLLGALVHKYIEYKQKLDELVGGKSDLFAKKTLSLNAETARFRELVRNHPLGEEKLKEAFPIFFEGLPC